jgi:hypothetical protein
MCHFPILECKKEECEKIMRIFYTIHRVNNVVYIEAINHKDEC